MRVLSVDLALKSSRELGIVVAERRDGALAYELRTLPLDAREPLEPERLADAIDALARRDDARLLLLDGPQAWKSATNGIAHMRLCERALAAPAKTGLPGEVKPAGYRAFVELSIAVFDALDARGWPRLASERWDGRPAAVESFPLAAWRGLGLPSLPAKAKTRGTVVADALATLVDEGLVLPGAAPSHDEVQAIVAAIGGLALAAGERERFRLAGVAPFREDGVWREGWILAPQVPGAARTRSRPRRVARTRGVIVCVDVDDLERAIDFYGHAFGWRLRRRFLDGEAAELDAGGTTVHLLRKNRGSVATAAGARRDYERHWTPVHLDVVVEDVERALATVLAAGATAEGGIVDFPGGRVAPLVDPFGHGICVLELRPETESPE